MGDAILDTISEKANALLKENPQIKVLEAGCGSSTHVNLVNVTHAVGIDISEEQLEKNVMIQEKILGDIQVYPLPKAEFDVAICWMVLEHLDRPKDALLNMFAALKPKGLLILGIPNLISVKGIVTKVTPFWFHEFFYRLMGYKSHPFPTYLRASIIPTRLVKFAEQNGFSVEFYELLEGATAKKFKSRFWTAKVAFSAIDSVTRIATLGKTSSLLLDNCFLILRKRDQSVAQASSQVPEQVFDRIS